MRVDGDGGHAFDRRDVLEVLAEILVVDSEIVGKRKDNGRNNAVRKIVGVTDHF